MYNQYFIHGKQIFLNKHNIYNFDVTRYIIICTWRKKLSSYFVVTTRISRYILIWYTYVYVLIQYILSTYYYIRA